MALGVALGGSKEAKERACGVKERGFSAFSIDRSMLVRPGSSLSKKKKMTSSSSAFLFHFFCTTSLHLFPLLCALAMKDKKKPPPSSFLHDSAFSVSAPFGEDARRAFEGEFAQTTFGGDFSDQSLFGRFMCRRSDGDTWNPRVAL